MNILCALMAINFRISNSLKIQRNVSKIIDGLTKAKFYSKHTEYC